MSRSMVQSAIWFLEEGLYKSLSVNELGLNLKKLDLGVYDLLLFTREKHGHGAS